MKGLLEANSLVQAHPGLRLEGRAKSCLSGSSCLVFLVYAIQGLSRSSQLVGLVQHVLACPVSIGLSELVCARLGLSGLVRAGLGSSELVPARLGLYGLVRARRDSSGLVRARPG